MPGLGKGQRERLGGRELGRDPGGRLGPGSWGSPCFLDSRECEVNVPLPLGGGDHVAESSESIFVALFIINYYYY